MERGDARKAWRNMLIVISDPNLSICRIAQPKGDWSNFLPVIRESQDRLPLADSCQILFTSVSIESRKVGGCHARTHFRRGSGGNHSRKFREVTHSRRSHLLRWNDN